MARARYPPLRPVSSPPRPVAPGVARQATVCTAGAASHSSERAKRPSSESCDGRVRCKNLPFGRGEGIGRMGARGPHCAGFALPAVRVVCAGLAACGRICRMSEKMQVVNGLVRGRFERWAATGNPDAQNGKSDLPMASGLNGASAPGFRKSFASGVFSGDGRFDSLSSGKRPAKRRRPAGFRRTSARNPTGRMPPTVGDRWLRAVGRGPRTARCTPHHTSACGMRPGRAARYERRARYGARSLTPRSSPRRARCGSRRDSP